MTPVPGKAAVASGKNFTQVMQTIYATEGSCAQRNDQMPLRY